STVGAGSTFLVTLPLAASTAAVATRGPDLRSLCALVLDRSATNRRVLQTYLAAAGVRPVVAKSPEEAIDLAAAEKIDVLVLESGLPENGSARLIETLRLIPGLSTLSCVLIGPAGEAPPSALKNGVEWLMRPTREAELLDALASLTDRG